MEFDGCIFSSLFRSQITRRYFNSFVNSTSLQAAKGKKCFRALISFLFPWLTKNLLLEAFSVLVCLLIFVEIQESFVLIYCPHSHFRVGAARFFGASFKLISNLQCAFVFCCCCNGKVKVTY